MTARDISASMLQKYPYTLNIRSKYNLNAQAHDTTIQLLREIVDAGVNVKEVEKVISLKIYVDTVGPPEPYERKLSSLFQGIKVTVNFFLRLLLLTDKKVSKKADSKYPIVSTASICAKVKRDLILRTWVFNETGNFSHNFGSGYPSGYNSI